VRGLKSAPAGVLEISEKLGDAPAALAGLIEKSFERLI
jgi:hypothetical protein